MRDPIKLGWVAHSDSATAPVWCFIIWLIMGGLVGWITSMVMGTDAQQGIILNIVVGIVGALLGAGSINDGITAMSFIVSLIGAMLLIEILSLFRRGSTR